MSGVSIRYRGSDGREYPDAGSMIRAGVNRVLENRYRAIESAVRQYRCPEHGETATVRRGRSGSKVNFEIAACCEAAAAAARDAGVRALRR